MRKGRILAVLFLTMITHAAFAQADSTWIRANNAYANGQYTEALNQYNLLLEAGREAPELYYNLGNTYFKQDVLGKAILYYEKALKLAPKDEDIQHNLTLARSKQMDKTEVTSQFFLTEWYTSLTQSKLADTWAIYGVAAFVVFLLLMLVAIFFKQLRLRRFSFWVGCLVLLCSIVLIQFAARQKHAETDNSKAIVLAPVVMVKSSPDGNGKDLFIVHEGLKVTVTEELSGWKKIALQDGSQGWVQSETTERI